MTLMTVEEQIARGFTYDCEYCDTGKVALTAFSHGYATWLCIGGCGNESYSLEGDDDE
jgi:hypothetical protein